MIAGSSSINIPGGNSIDEISNGKRQLPRFHPLPHTYSLPSEAYVTMTVYNVFGQVVALLRDGVEKMGYKEAVWNGTNEAGSPLPSGAYFLRLLARDLEGSASSFTQTI